MSQETRVRLNPKYIPLAATIAVFMVLYLGAGMAFQGFLSLPVLVNFLNDNAFLGITAVGMTFVILSGGIDLSVGSMIAFSGVLMASLVERHGMNPLVVMGIVLVSGAALGLMMGLIIHFLNAPPFIVTLGGMFLARGLGQLISLESIPINNGFITRLAAFGLPIREDVSLPFVAILFLAVFGVGLFLAHFTRFGRAVYAIGGNAQSALFMGLPVGRTRVLVYMLSGLFSALGGIAYTLYTSAGYGLAGVGFELDVIAAVVIGGTLITGGVGYLVGTFFGVMIQGVIQTAIIFQGTLNSWWTRIFLGFLLLVFILFQRLLSRSPLKR